MTLAAVVVLNLAGRDGEEWKLATERREGCWERLLLLPNLEPNEDIGRGSMARGTRGERRKSGSWEVVGVEEKGRGGRGLRALEILARAHFDRACLFSSSPQRRRRKMSGGYNPAIKKKFVSPFISQNPSTPSSSSSNTKGTPANKRKLEGPAPPQPHAGPSRPSAVKKEVLSGAVRSYNTTPLIKRNVFYGVAQAAEEAGQGGDVVDEYW